MNTKNIAKIITSKQTEFNKIIEETLNEFGFKSSVNHPDFVIITNEEKDSIGIEELKKLKSWAYTRPFNSEKKLAIIHDAGLLTIQAQNSILKIMEEPPQFTHIYLVVENISNILDTIISRSHLIDKIISENNESDDVNKFLSSDLQSKFEIVEKVAKEKKSFISDFLNKIAIKYRGEQNAFILNKVLEAKKYLYANVSKKILLENLAIFLEELKDTKRIG